MSYYGYGGSSSSTSQSLSSIGNNPGGKSGCDGCSTPLRLAGDNFDDGFSIADIVVFSICLVLTLASVASIGLFKRWADAVSSTFHKHGIKTLLLALLCLMVSWALSIADVAMNEKNARVTRAYLVMYVILYALYLGSTTLLLVAASRFIRTASAAGPVNGARSYVPIAVLTLVGAMALGTIAAYLAYQVWNINVNTSNFYYSSAVTAHITYLRYVYRVMELVWSLVYIFAAFYVLTTISGRFSASGAARSLIVFAILALLLQAILTLVEDAIVVYAHNNVIRGDAVGLAYYVFAAELVSDFLVAFAGLMIVLAGVVAGRGLATREKPYVSQDPEAQAHVIR